MMVQLDGQGSAKVADIANAVTLKDGGPLSCAMAARWAVEVLWALLQEGDESVVELLDPHGTWDQRRKVPVWHGAVVRFPCDADQWRGPEMLTERIDPTYDDLSTPPPPMERHLFRADATLIQPGREAEIRGILFTDQSCRCGAYEWLLDLGADPERRPYAPVCQVESINGDRATVLVRGLSEPLEMSVYDLAPVAPERETR